MSPPRRKSSFPKQYRRVEVLVRQNKWWNFVAQACHGTKHM